MMKKTILCLCFALLTAISTQESTLITTTVLPEVVVIGVSIEKEIYSTLVEGKDSVRVLNGQKIYYVRVLPLDSAMARYVLAQAYFESGSFEAPLAVRHNNYYGMMHPGRGKYTTSLGPWARAEGRNGYASYETPAQSAQDLVLLLDFYKIPHRIKTVEQYVRLIKKNHYFTSGEAAYVAGLKYHLKHVDKLLQKPIRKN